MTGLLRDHDPAAAEPGTSGADSRLSGDRLTEALRSMASEAPVSFRVSGQCMEPVLAEETEVIVSRQRWYWPGDILAFHSAVGDLRVHRLIGYTLRHGRLLMQMRADASGTVDQPVTTDQVIGRVIACPSPLRVSIGSRLRAMTNFLKLQTRRFVGR